MTDLRQAAQMALEALEYTTTLANFLLRNEKDIDPMLKANEAITALRAALKQQAEPIGWLDGNDKLAEFMHRDLKAEHDKRGSATPRDFTVPVYTIPPQRKPLTIAEVEQILAQHNYEIHGDRARYIVRMTEKAHGIKENT